MVPYRYIGVIMQDYQLIQLCLDGKTEYYETLISRYKKLVFSIVCNMIRGRDLVEDVAQEVFIKVYYNLGKYDPQYSFSTWISRVTTNLCLDTLRKKRPVQVALDDVVIAEDEAATPEKVFLNREKSQLIQSELDKLPEMYRIPILLYHKSNLTYEEISITLDVPMSIVKNRIFRARKMLKQRLQLKMEEGVL